MLRSVATKLSKTPRTQKLGALALLVGATAWSASVTPGRPAPDQDPAQENKEATMRHATGEFDVSVTPLALDGPAEDAAFGRMSIVKQYRGPLDAVGEGQMLTAQSPVEGSAAYVAIERVTGALEGREGSFALQHAGTMGRGALELAIRVVPDSGTGGLEGLAGTLDIRIEGGKHFYDLAYTLP